MAESDGEIEYLEEDAEIVQQCVHLPKSQIKQEPGFKSQESLPVLLIERPERSRQISRKRIIKTEENDSDYDPSEDFAPPSPPSPPQKKKRQPPPKRSKPVTDNSSSIQIKVREPQHLSGKQQFVNRKNYNIRIPDYDDPLCLPVRAIKVNESDNKRLNNWNSVCLEHFKYSDELLKPERGETKKSVRTAVFKNVVNKQTGGVETTIWSKTCVENIDGDKKSEIFQCVLPRYKEKRVLNNYILGNRRTRSIGSMSEVILSKEDHKDGEALIVYKPKESLSAVYGMIDKRKKSDEPDPSIHSDEDSKSYLQELASCKLCAPCFQGSWRGVKKIKNKSLVCPICARTYVSVYNLLSHFKTHSRADVLRYQKIIGAILSEVVGYHYKCRICRQKFDSIKSLRKHVLKHQSREAFMCEVGNHLVNASK